MRHETERPMAEDHVTRGRIAYRKDPLIRKQHNGKAEEESWEVSIGYGVACVVTGEAKVVRKRSNKNGYKMRNLDEEEKKLCNEVSQRVLFIRRYRTKTEKIRILQQQLRRLEEINLPKVIATEDNDGPFLNALYHCRQAEAPPSLRADSFEVRDTEDRTVAKIHVNITMEKLSAMRGDKVTPIG